MSTATPAEAFEHGDERRYRRGCRCQKCRSGANQANIRRRYLRQTGRGAERAPHRAAARVEHLRAAGLDDRDIRAQASICCDILYRIMRREGTIRLATEQRILAVPVPQSSGPTKSRAYIDGLGTLRRLQALAAAGWYPAEVARRLGRQRENIRQLMRSGDTARVAMRQAAAIRHLYEELQDQVPEDHGVPHHYAERARKQAASNGWAAPAYWDDDEFDNPEFTPVVSGHLKRNDMAAIRRAEVEHLASFGLSEHEIAERLGMAYTTVRNIVLELRTGRRRIRPPEGRNAPSTEFGRAA